MQFKCNSSKNELKGRVFPVTEGTAAILDADSFFHVVAQVKSPGAKKDEILAGPDFPTHCRLKVSPFHFSLIEIILRLVAGSKHFW